jgi:hypothetical protein
MTPLPIHRKATPGREGREHAIETAKRKLTETNFLFVNQE